MDSETWLNSADPAAMLTALQHETAYRIGEWDRKLRLWVEAAGCPQCHAAVRGIEYGPEGAAAYVATADCGDLPHKVALLRCIVGNPFRPVKVNEPLTCSRGHAAFSPVKFDNYPVPLSVCLTCFEHGPPWPDVQKGKPPAWLTPQAVSIARRIYEERDFAGMPVLADALEDAGCRDAAILAHCRDDAACPRCYGHCVDPHVGSEDGGEIPDCPRCNGMGRVPATHARGCWCVDLLLGKE